MTSTDRCSPAAEDPAADAVSGDADPDHSGAEEPVISGDAFAALADPVRRRILELLADGDASAGTVAELIGAQFSISQPATSQHLRVLRESGLVTANRAGRRQLYGLDQSALAAPARWLAGLRRGHHQPLDALDTELARGRRHRGMGRSGAGAVPDVGPDPDTSAAAGGAETA